MNLSRLIQRRGCVGQYCAVGLTGRTTHYQSRGSTCYSTHTASGFKGIATYHPAAVLRAWNLRPLSSLTSERFFEKAPTRDNPDPTAKSGSNQPWRISMIHRSTLKEFHSLVSTLRQLDDTLHVLELGFAVTGHRYYPSVMEAIGKNIGPSAELEREVWGYIRELIGIQARGSCSQNGLYGHSFSISEYGDQVRGQVRIRCCSIIVFSLRASRDGFCGVVTLMRAAGRYEEV